VSTSFIRTVVIIGLVSDQHIRNLQFSQRFRVTDLSLAWLIGFFAKTPHEIDELFQTKFRRSQTISPNPRSTAPANVGCDPDGATPAPLGLSLLTLEMMSLRYPLTIIIRGLAVRSSFSTGMDDADDGLSWSSMASSAILQYVPFYEPAVENKACVEKERRCAYVQTARRICLLRISRRTWRCHSSFRHLITGSWKVNATGTCTGLVPSTLLVITFCNSRRGHSMLWCVLRIDRGAYKLSHLTGRRRGTD